MVTHQGNPVSKGAAVGRVYKYVPYQAVVEQTGIRPEQMCIRDRGWTPPPQMGMVGFRWQQGRLNWWAVLKYCCRVRG